jgi:non-ribosomal peptide synthetase component E (peptide arylation enzyme)
VQDVAVLGTDDGALAAVVVLDKRPTTASEGLRRYVAERLPEFMVPTVLLELEQLPLTSHGKVDHARLAGLLSEDARREAR